MLKGEIMIERSFVQQKLHEFEMRTIINGKLKRLGFSHADIQRTPLGEKIILYGLSPGRLIGRGGKTIKELTEMLKDKFNLENPQIEVKELDSPWLNPVVVAEYIARNLERRGPRQFKGIVHRAISNVMNAGAQGVEIRLSGKVPSDRSKTWRFFTGYLKKCGFPSMSDVKSFTTNSLLKAGTVGIKVKIMPPNVVLPDVVTLKEVVEEVKDESAEKEKPKKVVKKSKEANEAKSAETKKEEVKKEDKTSEAKKKATKENSKSDEKETKKKVNKKKEVKEQ